MKYICLLCDTTELIPYDVVREMDRMDQGGDQSVAPMFECEHCGASMYPESYIGISGVHYKFSDMK